MENLEINYVKSIVHFHLIQRPLRLKGENKTMKIPHPKTSCIFVLSLPSQ